MMNQDAERAFWMVWSPQGRAPTVQHRHPDDAEQEAKRLARLNPGCQFYTLAVCRGFEALEPVREIEIDQIPF